MAEANGAHGSDGVGEAARNGSGGDAFPSATGPLAGITVLDFTRFQQGTHGVVLLADMGADIIKIEPPGGDPGRRLAVHVDGHSSYFEALNRNKRSISLDLRKPDAVEVVKRLARRADIVTENFRPGTLEKLGLGYEVLAKETPALIYAAGSMFGPKGPRSRDPGYDTIAQAAGGMMMYNLHFHRAWHDETPFPAQPGQADQTGGMMLAYGVLAALVHRLRTGRGQKVDVSLYGSQVSLQSIQFARALHPTPLKPPGQSSGVLSHRSICGDGLWIAFGFLEAHKWPTLARGLGLDELLTDPLFATSEARGKHHGELVEIIDATVATRPAAEWIERLRAADCPCAIVQDYQMIAEDEQALANQYVVEYDHPWHGRVPASGFAATLEETPASVRRHAPLYPGEHTVTILREAGYGESEVSALLQSGAALVEEPQRSAPVAGD